MKCFRLILSLLIAAILTSSCSTSKVVDELLVRETELQKGIETKTDSCKLLWLLNTYASWAEIDLYSLQSSEAINIASKLKNYTLDVSNLSQSDPNLGPEYFNDLAFVLEKISGTDLAARFLTEIGRTYFSNCGYFSISDVSSDNQNTVPQPEYVEEVDGNREACRIYHETYDEAIQLPFGSPKLSYILKNGYTKAMKYADDDLALDFQILIEGKPGSSQVIFDVNEICGQYR